MNISYRWLRALAPDLELSAPQVAERLASLGLAEAVWESELTASSLARAIDAAYRRPVAAGPGLERAALNLDGAAATARLVMALARRPAHAEALGAGGR